MGTSCPPESPIRRLKKSSAERLAPTEKVPAFSRKKARFSGKKSEKRVRLTCWSSTSACAKSVLTVRSSVRLWLRPIFASPPTFAPNSASGVATV
jgi:hypothetical protein